MFSLDDRFAAKAILGCADGPASFPVEARLRNWNVVSCDPIYAYAPCEIRQRIAETYATVMQQIQQNADDFLWTHFSSPDHLGRVRMAAMNLFLEDFAAMGNGSQYVAAELPQLPFVERQFDVALVSHFLFLYSSLLNLEFHAASICELLRVAKEVRIFPVTSLDGSVSPHLEPLLNDLRFDGELIRVEYEFARNANEMLLVRERL
ncbi:hypothetical protein [Lignipirellula cremea]|uniref:SAM-dependent methyltransferase n=1 Tax=Lignipirellula cremea TaxID=2528010 RepID=A0A518E119_9BACT|nr:hypothetical protein [Lignipirellula cremea]QDU97789.1 hypothetical protein Pla8534_56450 [Lignipirellula cremea]